MKKECNRNLAFLLSTTLPDDCLDYVSGGGDQALIIEKPTFMISGARISEPDYIFDNRHRVVEKAYSFPGLSGTGTLPLVETVFASIVDEPDPGYYRYILEVLFEYPEVGGVEVEVLTDLLQQRSVSAQVVKQ